MIFPAPLTIFHLKYVLVAGFGRVIQSKELYSHSYKINNVDLLWSVCLWPSSNWSIIVHNSQMTEIRISAWTWINRMQCKMIVNDVKWLSQIFTFSDSLFRIFEGGCLVSSLPSIAKVSSIWLSKNEIKTSWGGAVPSSVLAGVCLVYLGLVAKNG